MKPTPEQIEALKNNEKPIVLMSKELREAMWGMSLQDFRTPKYNSKPEDVEWVMGSVKTSFDKLNGDELNMVYRLRDDYQPESEIIECEIYKAGSNDESLMYEYGKYTKCLSDAINNPLFNGFLFKDVYDDEQYGEPWLRLDPEHDGNYTWHHATHILFRGDK